MKGKAPKTIYLKDYTPADFVVGSVFMYVDLHENVSTVKTILEMCRNEKADKKSAPLELSGEDMKLKAVSVDGKLLSKDQYQVIGDRLIISTVPDKFTLETVVEIKPQENTKLSGIYKSGGNFCSQCESHGFRRITYFLDRPDVMTRFTTTISADKDKYPQLLSNGNLVDAKALENNRHWVKWEDPSLKPAYLFALVAGDFDVLEDVFTTMSGRKVDLRVYVEKDKSSQAVHAMHSLKRAMRWDEEVYGREYDLDVYMIVAVNDFNYGAMENKGLNIFNDKYILARPEMATDQEYIAIESVVGHEYFHNWSGNRVTCRDWFQISLKEGFTVFREQSFTADMTSKVVKRIDDVQVIRSAQFAQDAGSMAHPVRPESYIEINNFYTVTVYNKGAEVIRMMHTILGPERFRKGTDLYFSRNDGCAVTTNDFVQALQDASGVDLEQFKRWYAQSGTPVLDVDTSYDADKKTYQIRVKQSCPPTPRQPKKQPFHIPLAVGLLAKDGSDMPLQLATGEKAETTTYILNVKNDSETFEFVNVSEEPVPSLLRNFSAPVRLFYNYSEAELLFLWANDNDGFNRYNAGRLLATNCIFNLIDSLQADKALALDDGFIEAFSSILNDDSMGGSLKTRMLSLPSESFLMGLMDVVDIDALYQARKFVKTTLATRLEDQLLQVYKDNHDTGEFDLSAEGMAKRSLKNLCLAYLALLDTDSVRQLCFDQFKQANNMTDTMGALLAINDLDCDERKTMLDEFYKQWQSEPLVIDKWFSVQARSTQKNTFDMVKTLMQHKDFHVKNPNRVRALIGVFCSGNHVRFHDKSGKGYEFLADQLLAVDAINSQVAGRLVEPFTQVEKFDDKRQALMREQLERLAKENLSKDLYEVVTKTLNRDST